MIEYLEIRYPLGQRRMMTMAEYAALPATEVRGTHARWVTRLEWIRHRHTWRAS